MSKKLPRCFAVNRALILVAAAQLLMSGCAPGPSDEAAPNQPADRSLTESQLAAIRLNVADEAGLQHLIEKYRGHVVLIDYWATWCGPCLEQFPHTVSLSRRYADAGLRVVSVCLDEPQNQQNALNFLRDKQASFDNLLSKYGGGPAAMKAFNVEGGALPHYKLFDREGQLRETFSLDPAAAVQFTTADIEAAVVDLLQAN
jgi:thiol-disulfide isomerase/thioredoxin